MHRAARLPLQIIDVAGGCVVAACICGFVWLTLLREDRAGGEVQTLAHLIDQADQDTRSLRAARDRQHGLLEKRRVELAESGQPPAHAPVEEYFRVLSTMASQHRLRVVRHSPLAPKEYPGLLEQRYAYEVVGSFLDLMGFLHAIEQTDYWADVSYLKVDRGANPADPLTDQRVAALTISLFAASHDDVPADGGGT